MIETPKPDDRLWLFVTLYGPARTIQRWGTAYPQWVRKRLGGRQRTRETVVPLTDGIAFGPYRWRDGWDALQGVWESITQQWPTLTVILAVGYPGDLTDWLFLEFPDESPSEDEEPVLTTVRVARGQWDVLEESWDRDTVHAFFFEVSTAGVPEILERLDEDLDYAMHWDLVELDQRVVTVETAAQDAQLSWHHTLEQRRRDTPEDPVEVWEEAINALHDAQDFDLHPENFLPAIPDDDREDVDTEEPEIVPEHPEIPKGTEEAWDASPSSADEEPLPDDLPF